MLKSIPHPMTSPARKRSWVEIRTVAGEKNLLVKIGPYGVPVFSEAKQSPSSPWYPHELDSHPGKRDGLTSGPLNLQKTNEQLIRNSDVRSSYPIPICL